MSDEMIRIVYTSRNELDLPHDAMMAEIARILEAARRNNPELGVTGALIFNRGIFAQVLEGPGDAVEEIFDRIQLDDRHRDVTVLDLCPIADRQFARWSMGFVGTETVLGEAFAKLTDGAVPDLGALAADEIVAGLGRIAVKGELSAVPA